MKTRSMAAAFAVAALLAGFGVATASAAPPSDVVIHVTPNTMPPPPFGNGPCQPYFCGKWDLRVTARAFSDSGNYVPLGAASSPPNRPFCTSGPLREHFLLTSSGGSGTLTVNTEELITVTCTPNGLNIVQTGVWQIEPGTGAYARVSGHGDLSAVHDPIVILTFAGVISKAG